MITVKVLLGKDTVSIYRKTGDISSVESTAESGGYVITRHFETEAEYKAYAMAVEDLAGSSVPQRGICPADRRCN